MYFRIISVLAIIGVLNLTSCMQDHPNPSDLQKEINVSASIEGATNFGVMTRVTGNSWNDGDAIGIFMRKSGSPLSLPALAENAKYITTGSSGFYPAQSNEIYFPVNNENVDFIAYYPHTKSLDGLNYLVDVSDQTNISDIDLLYSNNAKDLNASDGNIKLNFKRQLSNVVLNISKAGAHEADLSNLKAEITNINTKASFSLIDGSISDGSEPKNVSFKMSANGKYGQAILLPTNILNNTSLKLKIDTTFFIYKLTDATNIKAFEKSKKYTFEITLKSGDVTLVENVTATIEDWIDGGTEHITIYEDSTNNPSENPSGEDGEGEDTEGNGEEEGTGEGNDLKEGDGTEENPYTVEQVQNMSPKRKVWVKGYIVGMYTGWAKSSFITDNFDQTGNVAVATSSTETDFNKTFQIDFRDNPSLGDKIQLKKNPDVLGKKAYLYGDIKDSPQKDYGEGVILKTISTTVIIFED